MVPDLPAEVGWERGRLARDLIAATLEACFHRFARAGHALLSGQYSVLHRARLESPSGCPAFAVTPPASAGGHRGLGQNRDGIPPVRGLVVRLSGPPCETDYREIPGG
jgi:hypothetical protein